MPIYEYRCGSCGHQDEFLQKLRDDPIKACPRCGSDQFSKLVSAAGFQLKGSGWYATDFKGNGSKPAAKEGSDAAGASKDESKPATSDAAKSSSAEGAKSAGCGGGCACHG